MKKLLFIYCLLLTTTISAQTISGYGLASGGGSFRQGSANLTSSIGGWLAPIAAKTAQKNVSTGLAESVLVKGKAQATHSAIEFYAYPNPATDRVRIQFTDYKADDRYKITVFDILGRVQIQDVGKHKGAAFCVDLTLTELKQGTYFIQIYNTTTNQRGSLKLVKQQGR